MTAARLWLIDRPKFGRSCLDCRTYVYDPDTGQPEMDRTKARRGLPMLMTKGTDPPCHSCGKTIGMPVRHWSKITDIPLSAYVTLRHYRMCKAVAWHVPDAHDKIVRRNAYIVRAVEESVDAGRSAGVLELLRLTGRT